MNRIDPSGQEYAPTKHMRQRTYPTPKAGGSPSYCKRGAGIFGYKTLEMLGPVAQKAFAEQDRGMGQRYICDRKNAHENDRTRQKRDRGLNWNGVKELMLEDGLTLDEAKREVATW
jgi:hypothetical protein